MRVLVIQLQVAHFSLMISAHVIETDANVKRGIHQYVYDSYGFSYTLKGIVTTWFNPLEEPEKLLAIEKASKSVDAVIIEPLEELDNFDYRVAYFVLSTPVELSVKEEEVEVESVLFPGATLKERVVTIYVTEKSTGKRLVLRINPAGFRPKFRVVETPF